MLRLRKSDRLLLLTSAGLSDLPTPFTFNLLSLIAFGTLINMAAIRLHPSLINKYITLFTVCINYNVPASILSKYFHFYIISLFQHLTNSLSNAYFNIPKINSVLYCADVQQYL